MNFNYKFANLLGTVYNQGNLIFSRDDSSVISPVGNRLTVFDLKSNKSQTLPVEATKSFVRVALSPNGVIVVAVTEEGEALVISLISKTVLHKHRFNREIHDVQFSPNGRFFSVTFDNEVHIYSAPGQKSRDFNPFHLEKKFSGSHDSTTCIDWTSDSLALAVGSKDMNTRVYAFNYSDRLGIYSIGGHSDVISGCFFAKNSLNLYTLSRSGQVCVWDCDTALEDLYDPIPKSDEPEAEKSTEEHKKRANIIRYKRRARHFYRELTKDQSNLTSCAYHKETKILVSGFSQGSFFLHEMPDFVMIHSLSLGEQSITATVLNRAGDWLALGTTGLGQLVVWEWQSQCYVLKQQGHYDQLLSLNYSPDGQYLATGGADGKVKLWNTSSGFCFVTFTEHTAGVTALQFTQSGRAVLSASLDGTVRAFDMTRYRNFRTFTTPRPTQFSCMAVDSSGDVVAAGSQDAFDVFVWSIQTGHLLEILSGHEAPVSGLSFGNTAASQLLVSSSWDKTCRVWDIFKTKGQQEPLHVHSEVLAVAFRPDGREIAVCALNCTVHFFDPVSAQQLGTIDAKNDLGKFRRETDLVSASTASKGRNFTTLCYSADGETILVGGRTKYICIYHTKEHVLIRRFEVSRNWSFAGMKEFLSKSLDSEFGSKARMDLGEDDSDRLKISLPGVKSSDMASRHFKPEIRVYSLQFSPTGQSWAACTTEGLLLYSTNTEELFDPFDLDTSITPASTRALLDETPKDFGRALIMSLRLNDPKLQQEIIEAIPVSEISLISSSIPDKYAVLLLQFCANQLNSSRHFQFYLFWIKSLLFSHGRKLKARSTTIMPVLHNLHKSLVIKKEDVLKIGLKNESLTAYASTVLELALKAKSSKESESEMEAEEDPNEAPLEAA